jgi:hypothetical protein
MVRNAKTIMAAGTAGLDRLLTNKRVERPKANVHPMSRVSVGNLCDGQPATLPEAVVPTVTITEVAEVPVTPTDPGTLQIGAGDAAGDMLQVRFTVPLNDPDGARDKLNVALCPAEIVELDDPEAVPKVKSGEEVPVPETTTICDPVPALSATIRFALTAPAAVGANVTLIAQLARGCTVVQLFVCVNSPASAPPSVTLVTVNATAPLFVSVTGVALLLLPTVCAGKLNAAGEKVVPATDAVVLMRVKTPPSFCDGTTRSCLPSPFMSAAAAGEPGPPNCCGVMTMYGPNVPSPFPNATPILL